MIYIYSSRILLHFNFNFEKKGFLVKDRDHYSSFIFQFFDFFKNNFIQRRRVEKISILLRK